MKNLLLFLLFLGFTFTVSQDDVEMSPEEERLFHQRLIARLGEEDRQRHRERLIFDFLSHPNESELIKLLEIVGGQQETLQEIRNRYTAAMEKIEPLPDPPTIADMRKQRLQEEALRDRFVAEAQDCLLDWQIDALVETRLYERGLPRVLTDSALESVLRLEGEQKKRIATAADKISRKIEEFYYEIREECAGAILKELTEKQRQKLFKIYGEEELRDYFLRRDLRTFNRHYAYFDLEERSKNRPFDFEEILSRHQ